MRLQNQNGVAAASSEDVGGGLTRMDSGSLDRWTQNLQDELDQAEALEDSKARSCTFLLL